MSDAAMAAPPMVKPKPKIGGLIAIGIWIAISIGLAIYIIRGFDPTLFTRFGPSYLSGLWITITLVVGSFVCGAVVSLPVALGRM